MRGVDAFEVLAHELRVVDVELEVEEVLNNLQQLSCLNRHPVENFRLHVEQSRDAEVLLVTVSHVVIFRTNHYFEAIDYIFVRQLLNRLLLDVSKFELTHLQLQDLFSGHYWHGVSCGTLVGLNGLFRTLFIFELLL